MKNFIVVALFSVFGFLYSNESKAQFVTIPDTAFASYLTNFGFGAAMNGNQLDTTHSLVVNTAWMNCSGKNISELYGIQFFDNLEDLNCNNNLLTSISNYPPNLQALDCSNNQITYLAPLPLTLDLLNCNFNELTLLPGLPASLTTLHCNYNNLTSLTPLPPFLIDLECGYNSLTSIPTLPASLDGLACDNNNLTTLPVLPITLSSLMCGSNLITSLPTLPIGLDLLWCGPNPLTSFPASFPSGLYSLDCRETQRSSLPTLPNSLLYLDCNFNQLTSLPNLPAGITELYCYGNQLTQLPTLPSTLEEVDASYNLLTTIPSLPNDISIDISQNLLTSLPPFPPNIGSLIVHSNPTLTCLPELTTFGSILFYNTGIQCLPNYGTVTYSNPSMVTVPLCDAFNLNGCDFYYNIAGKIYADDNANCINNLNEQLFSGIKINLLQGGNLLQQTYSSQGGNYTFDVANGSYQYSPDTLGMPFQIDCPASGFQSSNLTVADSIDIGMDFGIQCDNGFDVGISSFTRTVNFFPADTTVVTVKAGDLANLFNLSCANGVNGILTIYFAGPVQFGGSYPGSLTPVATSNSLTYTIPDFGAINMNSDFRFFMITDSTAQAGQQICFVSDIISIAGDNDFSNNQLTHCFSVVNSFDPNEKHVSPVSDIEQGQEWLTYTILFQNTGTAPAQHVVITDTLDANLQESTFTYLGSDHNPFVNVTGNIVNFTFANINLPDSTNDEPNSHGYVQYKIKLDAGLPIGTTIENSANIYFDFNPPVITNTTVNTIVTPTGINEISQGGFAVYPNPTNNILNIVSLETCEHKVSFSDLTGRIVFRKKFYGNNYEISIGDLAGGIYFVNVKSEFRNETMKIIVK